MLMRFVHAVAVAILVYVICIILAMILEPLGVKPSSVAASILDKFAYLFALLAGLFDFLGYGPSFGRG